MPKKPLSTLEYDLEDFPARHLPLGEDSMLRKTHGDATVGDAPTAESFRQKVAAMEAGEDHRAIVETPEPVAPPAPRLSPSDVLRALVYGDALLNPPPGATYFKKRMGK
jgi:hypothetical protein